MSSPALSPDGKSLIVVGSKCCEEPSGTDWNQAHNAEVLLINLVTMQRREIAKGVRAVAFWQLEK